MHYILAVLIGVLCSVSPAAAQVSIGIGLPSVSIGINLPVFPELVVVPNYPVYYAPRGNVNLFFYDGLYWAYQGDEWYSSSWYNGPWGLVGPEYVPAFVLRVPVRYYRQPPVAWVGWRSEAPPRWASAGAMTGSSVVAAGIGGTAVRVSRPPRCRCISDSTRGTVIRAWSSSACWSARGIAISRKILSCGSIVSREMRSSRNGALRRSRRRRPLRHWEAGPLRARGSSPPRRRSRASSPGPRHRRCGVISRRLPRR